MFESIQNGLRSALKNLQGKGKLSEGNMRDAIKQVEQSLLEADVSYAVVKEFLARISEKALGQKVLLALDPTEQFVGIVHDEILNLLGPVDASLNLKRDLTVIMLCGLQGAGKTTTCGKLAKLLQESKRKPLLCAADLQRPAAIDQLHVIGDSLKIPVYSDRTSKDPVKVCQEAVAKAKAQGADVVILDTAGRLAIDKELMDQLVRVENKVQPDQVYLVVDGMTGQDAVNSAKAFNEALELDGVIMTKLDGDTRGGALLSVKHVTGVPIKFLGTGEHLESLEPFRAEGMATRILGMGDVVGLVDLARKAVDEDEQKRLEAKMRAGEMSLDDFKKQMKMILQPGLMKNILQMLPGGGAILDQLSGGVPEKEAKRWIAIIDSMTPAERRTPKMIDSSRRNRIAKGAGTEPQEVSAVVKQFETVSPMLKKMASGGLADRLGTLQNMERSGMFNPGAQLPKTKGDTGKRLTPEEKAKMRKQREKEMRKKFGKGRGEG